jgi:hypothetical protein
MGELIGVRTRARDIRDGQCERTGIRQRNRLCDAGDIDRLIRIGK